MYRFGSNEAKQSASQRRSILAISCGLLLRNCFMLILFAFALALVIVGSMNEGSRGGQEGLVIVILISVVGLCSFCIDCRREFIT